LLDGLQDEGVTDFAAFAEGVGESMLLGKAEGMVASWATDAPAGFSEAQVEMLDGIMPALTLAYMLRTTNRAARTLITTYLGRDAAERVLAGNIVRGRAEPIRAIVWYSDLIGFTRISDTVSPDVVLALLNDYAEAQVEEIEAHGGHVLKFIGDRNARDLPDADTTRACKRRSTPPANLRRRIARAERTAPGRGLPVTEIRIWPCTWRTAVRQPRQPARLDFTVLGRAVNMARANGGAVRRARPEGHRVIGVCRAAGEARKCWSASAVRDEGHCAAAGIFTLDPGLEPLILSLSQARTCAVLPHSPARDRRSPPR
jgi:adenylate cyclase